MSLAHQSLLTVDYEVLNFHQQSNFVQILGPLQRGVLQFEVIAKISAAKVRFKPIEQEVVEEIEIWNVRTLKTHRDATSLYFTPLFHELLFST